MTGFAVNGASLEAVATTLEQLIHNLNPVGYSPVDYTHQLGGGHLPDELWTFDDLWGDAIHTIQSEVTALSSHLRQAVHHYEQIDGQVAAHSHRHAAAPKRTRTHSGSGGDAISTGSGPHSFDPAGAGKWPRQPSPTRIHGTTAVVGA